MSKHKRLLVVLLTLLATLFVGCAGEKVPMTHKSAPAEKTGTVQASLENSDGDYLTAIAEISQKSSGDVLFSYPTGKGQTSIKTVLIPDVYVLALQSGFECHLSAASLAKGTGKYLRCVMDPAEIEFTIEAGEITKVVIRLKYIFEGGEVPVVYTVGGLDVTMDGGTVETECTDKETCGSDARCLATNGILHCYEICEKNADCPEGKECFKLSGDFSLAGGSKDATLPKSVCVLLNTDDAGAAGAQNGTGGSAGEGNETGGMPSAGSPSTGGAETAGSSSTGGSSAGGAESGGSPSIGGATATGGSSNDAGSSNDPDGSTLSCSGPGIIATCKTERCVSGHIICKWNERLQYVASECICETEPDEGSGGASPGAGGSSSGGSSATGGSSSTAGTGGCPECEPEKTMVEFIAMTPSKLGNGTDVALSANPIIEFSRFGEAEWGRFCELNPAGNEFSCARELTKGDYLFTMDVIIPCNLGGCTYSRDNNQNGQNCQTLDLKTAKIFWGDFTDSSCGGHGDFLGSVRVFIEGEELSVRLVDAFDPNLPCNRESGICNGLFTVN